MSAATAPDAHAPTLPHGAGSDAPLALAPEAPTTARARSHSFSEGTGPTHLVAIAILIAMTAAWYFTLVHPYVTASTRAAVMNDRLVAARADVAKQAEEREALSATLRDQERTLAASTVRLHPASALNSRLAELTKLAETHELDVERVEPGAAIDTQLAVCVPLRLAARGTSPNTVRFIADLRATFPDVAIDTFDLTRQDGAHPASLQLDLVWYADRGAERTTGTTSN